MENPFFDPPSGWQIGGGYPRGHLSFGQIQVSIENFAKDNLQTWSIYRGLGAVETLFLNSKDGKFVGGTRGVI